MQAERAGEMRGFEISGFGSADAEHIQRSAEYLEQFSQRLLLRHSVAAVGEEAVRVLLAHSVQ